MLTVSASIILQSYVACKVARIAAHVIIQAANFGGFQSLDSV